MATKGTILPRDKHSSALIENDAKQPIQKSMKFLTTSVIVDTKKRQDYADVVDESGFTSRMHGAKSMQITLSIELLSSGDMSKLWAMSKEDADAYAASKIFEKLQTIEI
jgi:hypothetical protein